MGAKKGTIFYLQFHGYTCNNIDITNLFRRRFEIQMKGGLKK